MSSDITFENESLSTASPSSPSSTSTTMNTHIGWMVSASSYGWESPAVIAPTKHLTCFNPCIVTETVRTRHHTWSYQTITAWSPIDSNDPPPATPPSDNFSHYSLEELRLLDTWCCTVPDVAEKEEEKEEEKEDVGGKRPPFPFRDESVFDRSVLLCVSKQLTLEKLKEILIEDKDVLMRRSWVCSIY